MDINTEVDIITDDMIRGLRDSAASAGDHAMALLCDVHLGDVDADEGLEHLRIWSFLSAPDRRRVQAILCEDHVLETITEALSSAETLS